MRKYRKYCCACAKVQETFKVVDIDDDDAMQCVKFICCKCENVALIKRAEDENYNDYLFDI